VIAMAKRMTILEPLAQEKGGQDRVKRDPDGTIDEIVITDATSFHLKMMNDGCYWICVTCADGTEDHITIWAKQPRAKVVADYRRDP